MRVIKVKITEEVVNLECEPKGEMISESRSYLCIINGPQTGRNQNNKTKITTILCSCEHTQNLNNR